MNHLRNGANDKSISPNYVSDLHDTCITSEKPAQRAFYDHFVAYSQNCCTETVLAEGNGIRGHLKSKRECIDYQHGILPVMIGDSQVVSSAKDTLADLSIGRGILLVSGDKFTVTRLGRASDVIQDDSDIPELVSCD